MNNGKRPEQLGTGCPKCCVCSGPIYDLDSLAPGEVAMHPRCNEVSHNVTWQRLHLQAKARCTLPPCDVCGCRFAQGQRTAEAQICEECIRG